jgi:hypothetical protein
MALRRKMDYRVRADLVEQMSRRRFITNIGLDELVTWMAADFPERMEIAGVSQLIEINDLGIRSCNQMPADG